MQKGLIHLTKLSPAPERYLATFRTMDGTIGGPMDRTFIHLRDLDKFLRQVDIPGDRIRTALRDARSGKPADISDVVLCDHELKDFTFVDPGGLEGHDD
jgi:hypothetical protein